MHISFIEIRNFRKLKSIRIDFSPTTTLLVGANNSGKTSAMVALRLFLMKEARFGVTDFTLSNWSKLNSIAKDWVNNPEPADFTLGLDDEWDQVLPSLDVWIQASKEEIHYVSHLLPVLRWNGGLIGVRFRLEPEKVENLYKEYLVAYKASRDTIAAANESKQIGPDGRKDYSLSLWPSDLQEFLGHRGRLAAHFKVSSYILDRTKIVEPRGGIASPQVLPSGSLALESNPLKGLIQIDAVDAQRGFSDLSNPGTGERGNESREVGGTRKLSEQLKRYYTKHIDPSDLPDPTDIEALEGIHVAQVQFNNKLQSGFEKAFSELEGMGYPGLTDPKLQIATKVEPLEGLNHSSSVQYDVIAPDGDEFTVTAKLPEQSSGLGYQNLISIIFRLISFRDNWMQEGKAKKRAGLEVGEAKVHPPLHLVLVEEPEAHLHAQVQQVFIRKAYDVLRNHDVLRGKKDFSTQLVVSTHSSHIVYEGSFEALRYFRRLPPSEKGHTPFSAVVNLSSVFGGGGDTKKFQTRYLRTTHCDLFFADAVILVEGAAERMLLPHFIRENFQNPNFGLYHRYLSILEVGGSHAHKLKPLIDALSLPTLIITDLDSGLPDAATRRVKSAAPEKGKGMVTMNTTLTTWWPGEKDLDDLLNLNEKDKILPIDASSSLYVAYQGPVGILFKPKAGDKAVEVLAYTFEDSLALENIDVFEKIDGIGMIKRFSEAIANARDAKELSKMLYDSLDGAGKGKFALDVIFGVDPKDLKIPAYIRSGLEWLQEELKRKDEKILVIPIKVTDAESAAKSAGTLSPTPAVKDQPPAELTELRITIPAEIRTARIESAKKDSAE